MPAAAALTLTAFRASALEASGGRVFPRRLVICQPGSHDARERGKVIVSADTFDGLAERQREMKLGMRLALDAEHCTVPGTPAYLAGKEPRAVLAWATLTGSLSEGLVYDDIEPTPLGMEAWKNDQFQDVSPALFRRADGTVLAVHSAALCRHGEIDGLTIDAATAPAPLAPFFAALSATLPTSEPDPMKPTPELIALLALLSITLAADADEAATTKAITDATAKVKAAKEDDEEDKGKPEITALTARLDAIEKGDEQRRRDRLMEQAKAEGKVIPLSSEQWNLTALSTCEALVAGAKAGEVPMNAKTTGNGAGGGATLDAFSAEHEDVFSKMGITPDEAKKHLPQKAA